MSLMSDSAGDAGSVESGRAPLQLLVIECQSNLDWQECFQGAALSGSDLPSLPSGRRVEVTQAEFEDISIVSWGDKAGGCMASLRNGKTVRVDFVLFRSVTRGIHGQDSRNQLFALMHARIPAVNSLESVYGCLERVIVWGELVEVQRRLRDQGIPFPLVSQTYYSTFRSIVVTPETPCVAKVGAAHAGYGKVRLTGAEEIQDFKSHLALHGDYCTIEPFIEWDYDGRIQKIGNEYRSFRRRSPNWKGNVGNMSVLEDVPLTSKHKLWIDECAKAFGGLDICSLDFLHSEKDGKDYVLELNDTATGLVHKHAEADMRNIRDMVLAKMQAHFYPDESVGQAPLGEKRWRDSGVPADLPSSSDEEASSDEEGDHKLKEKDRLAFASAEAALLKQQADEIARLKHRVAELEALGAKKKSFFHRS